MAWSRSVLIHGCDFACRSRSREVLDRLRNLRPTVLGGLDRAPEIDTLRKLLRQRFERVSYVPGLCAPTLVFALKWELTDPDELAADRDPPIRQPLDLAPDAPISEHDAVPL
jgi:hypothetical protein